MSRPDASAGRIVHAPAERFFQFSLLGLLVSGYLAVAGSGYLDVPTLILAGAGLVFRGLTICGLVRLDLTERAATYAALAYAAFFALDYLLLSRDFLSATVHLVFFLALMKILTARNDRDYLALAAIAFLELVWAAILNISFNFLVFLTLFLTFGIAAMTSGEIRRASRQAPSATRGRMKRFHPRLAALTIWATLGIMALTAGMFFLLPRTAEAALSGLIAHRLHIPGLSNQVNLGEIGELKTSSQTVMHIAIYSLRPPGGLKWRGGVMTDFDGRTWKESEGKSIPHKVEDRRVELLNAMDRLPGTISISYRVQLAELDTSTLFLAGIPESLEGLPGPTLEETEMGCFRLGRKPPPEFRYEAVSRLEVRPENALRRDPPPVLKLSEREQCLQLPPLDPRIRTLARDMASDATNDSDLGRTRAIERRLRTGYGYTLQLPDHQVNDPLAYFLFTRKKGHCEYFASAMAVMLRSLGIPSRLVTGFQSGIYNPMSDLWVVRASDAHSWVEAWMPGLGWTTFDPTPPDPNPGGASLMTQLGLYLDAAETFWQSWVVGYDPGRQGTLADHVLAIRWLDSVSAPASLLEIRVRTWLKRFGPGAALSVGVVLWFWLVTPRLVRMLRVRRRVQRVRRGEASVADATLLYQRMLLVLKRHGYHKPGWFTPVEFARSLPGTELGRAVGEFTSAYNALRFGGHADAALRMSMLLDEMGRSNGA
jgi:protein-glutamine gamma-glutamyltransferase